MKKKIKITANIRQLFNAKTEIKKYDLKGTQFAGIYAKYLITCQKV
jgi:hypothetical protein